MSDSQATLPKKTGKVIFHGLVYTMVSLVVAVGQSVWDEAKTAKTTDFWTHYVNGIAFHCVAAPKTPDQ